MAERGRCVPPGRLPDESEADLDLLALVTPRDIVEAQRWPHAARVARRLLEAERAEEAPDAAL